MIEVEIKDFQAIEHLKFQIEGFTAVVGRSNIGKSSIIRALKAALSGAEGNNFVRHNPETCVRVLRGVKKCKCQCSVYFKFQDGRQLLWEKGDSINQYKATAVDGTETVYSNVGGKGTDAPTMLEKGFAPVELGQKKSLLQVADQFDPIFLLNLSGTIVADVLSDVAQLDEINKAMRLVSKDRRSASSTRKVRDEDVKNVQVKLEKYEDLDKALQKVGQIENNHDHVLKHMGSVEMVAGFLSEYVRAGVALKALKKALDPKLPEMDPLNSFAVRYSNAHRMLRDLEVGVVEVRSLMGVQKVEVPDIEKVRLLAGKVRETSELLKRLVAVAFSIRGLQGVDKVEVPPLPALSVKAHNLKALYQWESKHQALESELVQYDGFDAISVEDLNLQSLRQAKDTLSQTSTLHKKYDALCAVILETEKELESASIEESAILADFKALGVCPTCSQDITPGGHAH